MQRFWKLWKISKRKSTMSTNPYFTQYHTQRFSFIGSPQQRDGTATKDQRFLNMYPELIKSPISDGKKYYLKKRPGPLS